MSVAAQLKAMRDLLQEDPRFKLEAYQFIRESLQYAHENLDKVGPLGHAPGDNPAIDDARHLSGVQLCHACRLYAQDQFGYLAGLVLGRWGLTSTSDLGDLVYNLIRIKQMRKSDADRREDFNDVYDFRDVFEPQFELAEED